MTLEELANLRAPDSEPGAPTRAPSPSSSLPTRERRRRRAFGRPTVGQLGRARITLEALRELERENIERTERT